jgi:surface antigen
MFRHPAHERSRKAGQPANRNFTIFTFGAEAARAILALVVTSALLLGTLVGVASAATETAPPSTASAETVVATFEQQARFRGTDLGVLPETLDAGITVGTVTLHPGASTAAPVALDGFVDYGPVAENLSVLAAADSASLVRLGLVVPGSIDAQQYVLATTVPGDTESETRRDGIELRSDSGAVRIAAPIAVGATGTRIPASATIAGGSLVVDVGPSSADDDPLLVVITIEEIPSDRRDERGRHSESTAPAPSNSDSEAVDTWRQRGEHQSKGPQENPPVFAPVPDSSGELTAMATTITVRGTVICASGRTVVGVWIQSSAGGSGWATFTKLPGRPHVAYYTRTMTIGSTSSSVYPTVGCGGTPQSWASSNSAPAKSVSSTYVYNVRCSDPSSGKGSCSGAPLPSGRSTNWFASGNCTWGAAQLWKKATGQFPSWSGNAKQWNENAAALGFRTSSVPHERSVAVFEFGGSGNGHVAWVTRVWVSGSTIMFHVREMNVKGLGVWSERDIALGSGMSFIIAPPGVPVTS